MLSILVMVGENGSCSFDGVSSVLPDTTGFDCLHPITLDQSDSNLILV